MSQSMTLASVVRENARSSPTQPAVVCGLTSLDHSQLAQRIDRLTGVFADLGIGSGDRIVWLGQNCHRWLESLVAAGRLGAMLASLNWRLPASELGGILNDYEPQIVIWQRADLGPLAETLRPAHPGARWICHDTAQDDGYESLIQRTQPHPHRGLEDPDAPALLLSVADPSGGTNGSLLSQGNLLVPGLLMAQLQAIDSHSVHLVSAPLFHIAALFALIPTLQMRGTNVFVRRADATLVCEAINLHKCTHGLLFAPTIREIVELNADGRYNLKAFRSGIDMPGWQAMVSADSSAWGRHNGGYGQTETNMAVLASLTDGASNTSGRAAPYTEVCIADADDREVAAGEVGQILVRGASVHKGYWRRPDIDRQRFAGGWWHTRDLGTRNADGIVSFVGPMGRMIKAGAENIFGAEIERCLAQHAGVREAAIIGIPDETWVQSVKAIVVVDAQSAVTPEELIEHCRTRLASYKRPRSVVLRQEALPRVGPAIDYKSLDAAYGGGNYPGEGTRSV
jgi:acyl-CoA synthetase (AMP-forming)/AMP-acid ligase II